MYQSHLEGAILHGKGKDRDRDRGRYMDRVRDRDRDRDSRSNGGYGNGTGTGICMYGLESRCKYTYDPSDPLTIHMHSFAFIYRKYLASAASTVKYVQL